MSLYHQPAGTWKSLTHVEFFRYLSGYLLHNEDVTKPPENAEKVREWIDKELAQVAHIWSNDMKEWQHVMTQYFGVRSVTEPDGHYWSLALTHR